MTWKAWKQPLETTTAYSTWKQILIRSFLSSSGTLMMNLDPRSSRISRGMECCRKSFILKTTISQIWKFYDHYFVTNCHQCYQKVWTKSSQIFEKPKRPTSKQFWNFKRPSSKAFQKSSIVSIPKIMQKPVSTFSLFMYTTLCRPEVS